MSIPPSSPNVTPNSGATPIGGQPSEKTKAAVPATGAAASTDAAAASVIKPTTEPTEEISLVTPGAAAAIKAEGSHGKGLAEGVPVSDVQGVVGSYLSRLDRFRLKNANDSMSTEDIVRSEVSRFTAGARAPGAEYSAMMKLWTEKNVPIEEQYERLVLINAYAFGSDAWEDCFGGIIVGEIPTLPADFWETCIQGVDPNEPTQFISDSHTLVLVPSAIMVDGKQIEISINTLNNLVKKPKVGNPTSISGAAYLQKYKEWIFQRPVDTTHWVLKTKATVEKITNVGPGERPESFMFRYRNATKSQYYHLTTIDAIASILLTYVSLGSGWDNRKPNSIGDVITTQDWYVGPFYKQQGLRISPDRDDYRRCVAQIFPPPKFGTAPI